MGSMIKWLNYYGYVVYNSSKWHETVVLTLHTCALSTVFVCAYKHTAFSLVYGFYHHNMVDYSRIKKWYILNVVSLHSKSHKM